MPRRNNKSVLGLAAALSIAAAGSAQAAVNWDAFLIRDSNGATAGGTVPTFNERPSGAGIDTTVAAGEKVGYGTDFFDGQNVADVPSVNWDVLAAPNMGTPNEKSPYLNLWITKGGQSAVIAPSVGVVNPDVRGQDWDSLNMFIHERTTFATPGDLDWIETGAKRGTNAQLLHADDTAFTIGQLGALNVLLDDPNPGLPQGGAGAPKNGTAFNLIFGDSAANYVGSYSIDNVAVPEPTGLAVLALGGVLLLGRRRRRASN